MATTRYYAFHSDSWINLHHFLYQWARADRGIGEGRTAVSVPERDELDDLDVEDRRAWTAALAFYRAEVAERDHFDGAMLQVKAGLVDRGGDAKADPPDDIPGIAQALRSAMPVYLERWWPAHDRANRAWIADVGPRVDAHEEEFAPLAVRSFGGTWPDERRRVDVSAYANWQGGYTSLHPVHVVIISTSPKTRGFEGMEIAFHEVCHDGRVLGTTREEIREDFAAAGAEANRNLWHGMIFFTSGTFAQRIARASGRPDYVPHMVREGLTGFAGWRGIWEALDAEWPPVLQGERDRREALSAVVRRLADRTPGG